MKYRSLIFNNTKYTTQHQIEKILRDLKFFWLIDAEIEDAEIEIKNNTLIWHNGIFLSGQWIFGIFRNGNFYGNFINGIWEDGQFNGTGKISS
jgi:hypothetical protein